MKDSQINLSSDAARETVATLIATALKSEYTFIKLDDPVDILDLEVDPSDKIKHFADGFHEGKWEKDMYEDMGDGHLIKLTNDSEVIESIPTGRKELVEQAYREITSDGLPSGGDVEAMKLAEALVDDMKPGEYIYESADGGKTIFKRKIGDYKNKEQVELDFKNKKEKGN
jgi:hypothetical protein